MNRILLSLFFVAICLFSKAQQSIDSKIQEVYADKTQELVVNRPSRLAYLNDILQNRVIIETMVNEAGDKFPKLSQVELLNKYNPVLSREAVFNPETFNPLKYNFEFFSKSDVIYRVDNTDYVIIIKSQPIK